jgi:hypothetical protein
MQLCTKQESLFFATTSSSIHLASNEWVCYQLKTVHDENSLQDLKYKFRRVVLNVKKKSWEEVITYFPLIRHGPHRKLRVQQYFFCCSCICCRGNVFTEPLPSKDRGHRDAQINLRELYKCANEMGSDAVK